MIMFPNNVLFFCFCSLAFFNARPIFECDVKLHIKKNRRCVDCVEVEPTKSIAKPGDAIRTKLMSPHHPVPTRHGSEDRRFGVCRDQGKGISKARLDGSFPRNIPLDQNQHGSGSEVMSLGCSSARHVYSNQQLIRRLLCRT